MKYMMLIYGAESAWSEESREACMLDSMEICEGLAKAGELLDSSPLRSVSTATCLRIREGKTLITDGPFAETTEQLGGYYLLDVENLDRALEIAATIPPAKVGTVEIRPLEPLPERSDQDKEPAPREGLAFSRLVPVKPAELFRGWTEPELLKQWFCPAPWRVTAATLEPRPGGAFTTVMEGPNGERMENPGVYLEVEQDRKIVFTDAFQPGWIPKENPFMVATVTFTPEGDQTRYSAKVEHWTDEAEAQHRQMGFFEGWGTALDQLVALQGTMV